MNDAEAKTNREAWVADMQRNSTYTPITRRVPTGKRTPGYRYCCFAAAHDGVDIEAPEASQILATARSMEDGGTNFKTITSFLAESFAELSRTKKDEV